MSDTPNQFDWVTARSKCSVEPVFYALGDLVEADVAKVKAIEPTADFKVERNSEKISVAITRNDMGRGKYWRVTFILHEGRIVIRDGVHGRDLFVAKPALDANGQCRVLIDDATEGIELWQVSHRALEAAFFPE